MTNRKELIDTAAARRDADLVIKNTRILSTLTGEWWHGDIAICGEQIAGVGDSYRGATEIDGSALSVVPGFVDCHVHVESTRLVPAEYDRAVLPHGVTTAICDPHEMANVCGARAIQYFLDCADTLAMDLFVQLSSCVPATHMETSGATLTAADLAPFVEHPRVLGLAEMMNFPAVIAADPAVLEKIALFKNRADGHAPLVADHALNAYIAAGIGNDHECTHTAEALEKLRKGLRILLRSGSAAHNIAQFLPLLRWETAPTIGLCSDDLNIVDICQRGSIDEIVRTLLRHAVPSPLAYRLASLSGAEIHGLRDRGIIAPGYLADLVLLADPAECRIHSVIKRGRLVTPELFAARPPAPSPNFARHSVHLEEWKVESGKLKVGLAAPQARGETFNFRFSTFNSPVIGIIPDSLLTEKLAYDLPARDGETLADPTRDILKIAVAARHGKNENISVGFVKGFQLRDVALASTVAHDSHNLCVVGTSDTAILRAANAVIAAEGGQCVADENGALALLPLPVAGLMSDAPYEIVYDQSLALAAAARATETPLHDPFMTLSFLSLPVIPHLKITDRGLVDVDAFRFV